MEFVATTLETDVSRWAKQVELAVENPDAGIVTVLTECIQYAETSRENQLALRDNGLCQNLTKLLMSSSNENPEIASKILMTICRMCRRTMDKSTTNKQCIISFTEAGACTPIISTLKLNIENVDVVYAACWCIMVMGSDEDELLVHFANLGACECMLLALKKFSSDVNSIEIICRAVRNLSSNPSVAAFFVSEGIGEFLMDIIQYHTHNLAQLEAAIWVVVNLACDPDCATILGSTGMCQSIVTILSNHINTRSIANSCCCALRNLACASALNYTQLAHTDICELIINTLDTNKINIEVVESSLWVIANLSCDNELCIRLGQNTHNCNIIIHCAMDNIHNKSILESSIWAIRNLGSGGVTNQHNLIEMGAIDVIAYSFATYMTDEMIMEVTCGAVVNMIAGITIDNNNNEWRERFHHIAIIDKIFHVIQNFNTNEDMMLVAIKALKYLCKNSPNDGYRVKELNMLPLIVQCFHSFKLNNDIIKYCCEILFYLYYNNEKEHLHSLGAIDDNGDVIVKSYDEMVALWTPQQFMESNGLN